jgi:hypothetical protein
MTRSPAVGNAGDAARRFRTALETAESPRLLGLRSFPKAACGDASRLLAQYLRDRGFGEWTIVTAWRDGMSRTHAWLEQDGWLIDITADQFEDVSEPVIATRRSDWHDGWEVRQPNTHRVGLAHYDSTCGADEDYDRLSRLADQLEAA